MKSYQSKQSNMDRVDGLADDRQGNKSANAASAHLPVASGRTMAKDSTERPKSRWQRPQTTSAAAYR